VNQSFVYLDPTLIGLSLNINDTHEVYLFIFIIIMLLDRSPLEGEIIKKIKEK